MNPNSNLHQGQRVLQRGSLENARAAMIMAHGRGATADDILSLADAIDAPDVVYLAPQAANYTWYPNRFIMPIEANEPYLSSALQVLADLVAHLETSGIPAERIILLGFSQGACLSLEYAVRNPRRYGGIAGLSGGLIGPPGTTWDYPATLAGTPVFLGCSDVDFHIPKERVLETDTVMTRLGAQVTTRLYPGMGHLVNDDEIEHVRQLIAGISGSEESKS